MHGHVAASVCACACACAPYSDSLKGRALTLENIQELADDSRSVAAASLAGCVFRVRTLPSILFLMVVMCPLHLAIFLEISGAVAFLHSLLMRLIVASDNVADAILILLPLQRLSIAPT